MVRALTVAFALLVVAGVAGCTGLSSVEAKLVGTWAIPSIEGDIDYIYQADHTWVVQGGASDLPLKGHWWIEGNQLVSYLEPPKQYADNPEFAWLRQRRRETIIALTMKRLVLVREGSKTEILRVRCPRCGTLLGSFATYESLPTKRSSCPKCGLRLEDK